MNDYFMNGDYAPYFVEGQMACLFKSGTLEEAIAYAVERSSEIYSMTYGMWLIVREHLGDGVYRDHAHVCYDTTQLSQKESFFDAKTMKSTSERPR